MSNYTKQKYNGATQPNNAFNTNIPSMSGSKMNPETAAQLQYFLGKMASAILPQGSYGGRVGEFGASMGQNKLYEMEKANQIAKAQGADQTTGQTQQTPVIPQTQLDGQPQVGMNPQVTTQGIQPSLLPNAGLTQENMVQTLLNNGKNDDLKSFDPTTGKLEWHPAPKVELSNTQPMLNGAPNPQAPTQPQQVTPQVGMTQPNVQGTPTMEPQQFVSYPNQYGALTPGMQESAMAGAQKDVSYPTDLDVKKSIAERNRYHADAKNKHETQQFSNIPDANGNPSQKTDKNNLYNYKYNKVTGQWEYDKGIRTVKSTRAGSSGGTIKRANPKSYARSFVDIVGGDIKDYFLKQGDTAGYREVMDSLKTDINGNVNTSKFLNTMPKYLSVLYNDMYQGVDPTEYDINVSKRVTKNLTKLKRYRNKIDRGIDSDKGRTIKIISFNDANNLIKDDDSIIGDYKEVLYYDPEDNEMKRIVKNSKNVLEYKPL